MKMNERTKTWKQIKRHTQLIKKLKRELKNLEEALNEILDDELDQIERPLPRKTP